MTTATLTKPTTQFLDRGEGRIAYDIQGDGPLVICAPGMGDLRTSYRYLAPALAKHGYRVASMDLRGHGDSDLGFSRYDGVAAGTDLLALADRLGGPAILVGNSMAAGSAVWAAAESADVVKALVLLGPFVRQVAVGRLAELAFRIGLMRPWGPLAWNVYYGKLFPGHRPDDFDENRAKIRDSLRRPGRWSAFVATSHTSHAPAEARLDQVRQPTLVVMGDRDPDFPDPAAEARLVAERVHGEFFMVPNAGHYPQAEFPEIVTPRVAQFLDEVCAHA